MLVKDGQPRATIVIGAQPSADAREAAQELQSILLRVSGATLPIVEQAGSATGTRILVGQSAARDEAARLGLSIPSGLTNAFNEEGYVVAVQGDTVVLAGNETPPYQGTAYAVYDLLHQLGCRWYMPGAFGEVLPRLSTVEVAPVRRTVRPDFRIRNIWYSGWLTSTGKEGEEYTIWRRRNRMCRSDLVGANYLPIPGDDTAKYLLPKEKYFDDHPEYYALNADGTRNPDFLCMSNPGAFDAATQTIVEQFAARPQLHCFSFSPPDAPTLCHCKDCTAAMHGGFKGEGWGEVSDTYFDFVLRLSKRIAERCPGKLVTSMAYFNRCRPPVDATGRQDNLLMYLASIQQCPVHSYADDTCWSRRSFKHMLRRWSELSAGLVYYEYDPHDWSMFQRPTWRSDAIADDFRLLKDAGGWGFNDEGQIAWLSTGLNYYIRGRLGWNVKEDPQALVRDFCDRFFGPASAPMHRCYTAIERAMRDTKVERPHDIDYTAVYTRPVLDGCLAALQEARGRAVAEPYRKRVEAFAAYIGRLDSYLRAHAAMAAGDYRAAAAYGAAMEKAVADVGDPALLADYGPITKGSCSGASVRTLAETMGRFAYGPDGRLIAALTETATFRTDTLTEGIVAGWFRPKVAAAGWRQVRMSSPWYAQGVVTPQDKRYTGAAWYRVPVTLSESDARGPVRLMIPVARRGNVITVWCNGEFAAHSDAKGPDHRSIDLTGRARAGENLIAIRIEGDGGLSIPPFLYAPASSGGTGR